MSDAPGLEIRAAAMRAEAGEGAAATCDDLSREDAIATLREGKRIVWVDLRVRDVEDARKFLESDLGLHELTVEDALSDEERPGMQELPGWLFVGIPALIKSESDAGAAPNGPHRFTEVGFFLGSCCLVTVSREAVGAIDFWYARWVDHPGRLAQSPAHLLHAVIDGIVDEYFLALDEIEDEVDTVSERIFRGDESQVRSLMRLKRRLLSMRRQVSPVRDAMNGLLRHDLELIPDSARPYLQDVYDHVIRTTEMIDANRETLTSLVDVHLSMVSNNLNSVMKKMTVVSTLLMSAALIAGVYGMNFERMPELRWRYGYPGALGLMFAVALVQVAIFRRIRWL